MKRARIDHLHTAAKARRPGYLEACLREGKISVDGQWIMFDNEAHTKIRRKYNPMPSHNIPLPPVTPGLGDLVHKIAGPIGRAIKWPCLKGDGSTALKPGSPCDRARRALNRLKP